MAGISKGFKIIYITGMAKNGKDRNIKWLE